MDLFTKQTVSFGGRTLAGLFTKTLGRFGEGSQRAEQYTKQTGKYGVGSQKEEPFSGMTGKYGEESRSNKSCLKVPMEVVTKRQPINRGWQERGRESEVSD